MSRKNNRILFLILSLLITAVFLLAACGGSDPTPTIAPTAEIPPTPTATPKPTKNPEGGNIEAINDPSWARIQSTGKMLIGMSIDYPPFESYTEDFEPTGYDVALAQELGKRLGLEVEFKDIAFDGLGNAIQLGAIDTAISAISVSPERAALADFSDVYYISEDAILTYVDSGITEVPTIDEVADKKVGVQRGSIFEDWIRTELIEPGLMPEENLLVYLQAGDVVRDLREKRIDLAVLDLLPAKLAVAEFDDILIIGNGLNQQRYAIAMPQGSPLLQKALNQSLVDMKNEGILADLAKKYLDLDPDELIPLPTPDPSAPTVTPAPTRTGCVDHMTFIQDLNFDDGNMSNPAKFLPGQAFTKGWRIQNSGTCTWNSNYSFVYVRGNSPLSRMGGQPTPIKGTVAPGQIYDMYVNLVAPSEPGIYQGFWSMRNPSGLLFGESVWVGIEVIGSATATPAPTQTPVAGISFSVDRTTINEGECVTFTWNVQNIQAVFFYPQGADWTQNGVPGQGTSTQCPATTTTYELRVLKTDGTFEIRQITIFVNPSPTAPNINRFTVEPNQILTGQCVNIRWEVTGNISRVNISRNGVLIWDAAPVSGQMQDCPAGSGRMSYLLEATGSGGTSRQQRDITVVVPTAQPQPPTATPTPVVIPTATPAPPVINSFNVNPTSIESGQSVSINWSTGGGTTYIRILRNGSVIMDDAPHSGTIPDTLNSAGNYTYRIEASGNGQTVSDQRNVTVSAAPPPTATPNPLVGVNWTVNSLSGTTPTGLITTVFDADGRVSGTDGCNSYNGTYTASGNSLTISLSGVSTGLLCGEPVDSEAQTFRMILSTATSYGISNNQLTINGAGESITYNPGPQPR